jgi:NAD-dependent dihydropyrimidine dehydrogenase PreA subunit
MDGRGEEVHSMKPHELFDKQLYINPDECINCGACIPECPVDAIYRDETEAISMGDAISVHKNYEFYGYEFK